MADRQASVYAALRAPGADPRAFIMSAGAADFGASMRFVNALIKSGVAVHQATRVCRAGGNARPVLVVKSRRHFVRRDGHVRQDHPDDFAFPGRADPAMR
jgi:hypothetical protein